MAYVPLQMAGATPPAVANLVRNHLDMQFHDVHCMLRLPISEPGLDAGCNFAAATFLLSLIAGLSTALYRQDGDSGDRFREALRERYPWELEPQGGVAAEQGADDLYRLFRNPLAHALGLQTTERGRGADRRVTLRRRERREGLFILKSGGLPEEQIETLERARVRLAIAPATIVVEAGRRSLSVEGLYWGTREMVTRLTGDPVRMSSAEEFLAG